MGRLTERYTTTEKPDGESDVWVRNHDYTMAAERLADYEDTGLTPTEIRELKERDTAKPAIPISEESLYAICLNCGQTIFRDHRFCPDCGQRLKKEE